MIEKLAQAIRGLTKKKAADSAEEYERLVAACCDGQSTNPVEVAELLDRAGKTVEDLERDCGRLSERREKLLQARRLVGIRQEIAQLNAEITAEQRKIDAAVERGRAAIKPKAERLKAIESEEVATSYAREWLQNPETFPREAKEAYLDLVHRRTPLVQEMEELRRELNPEMSYSLVTALRGVELSLEAMAKRPDKQPGRQAEFRGRLATLSREVESKTARWRVVSREVADVNTKLEALLNQVTER